jgi:hypothetical protein
MIPCTDFIPAYSELFKYLDSRGGERAVVAFWEHLSDNYLGELRDLVSEHGLRGCWLYWTRTLNEEAADFTIELDEDAGEFRIEMHRCPSKGRLTDCPNIEPYSGYCRHCDVLYRRALEPLGYEYSIDLSHCDRAACTLVVRSKGA